VGDVFDVVLGQVGLRTKMVGGSSDRPVFREQGNPGGGALQGKLARGFRYRRGAYVFQEGEQLGQVLKEQRQVEIRAEVHSGSGGGMLADGIREMGIEAFLELREVLVEGHDLGGEGMNSGKMLGATNTRVVVGPAGF
jgi:hypothetical protein